jgi:hypothetical protein
MIEVSLLGNLEKKEAIGESWRGMEMGDWVESDWVESDGGSWRVMKDAGE